MRTERDRQAFNRDQAKQEEQKAIAKWLADNPAVGVLNINQYYIVRNNEVQLIEPLQELYQTNTTYSDGLVTQDPFATLEQAQHFMEEELKWENTVQITLSNAAGKVLAEGKGDFSNHE